MESLQQALDKISHQFGLLRDASRGLAKELERRARALAAQTQKSAELTARVAALELELKQARDEVTREREAAKAERERLLEQQDEFIAGLLEEQAILEASQTESREGKPPRTVTPAGLIDTDPAELQAQLRRANERIAKLSEDRGRFRDVLRRLQKQRDDAQRAVAQLTREARSFTPAAWSPDDAPPALEPAAPTATRGPNLPLERSRPRQNAKEVKPSAASRGAASPLAKALAATDPNHRKSSRRGGTGKSR